MKIAKLISLVLILSLIFSGPILAQEQEKEEARKMYEEAKRLVYEKEWSRAVDALRKFAQEFKKSAYLDDSIYWLSYSMYKLSASLDSIDQQIEIQKEALERLNSLIEGFSTSSWVYDAKTLRIEVAEDLVKKGLTDYRKYINGSLQAKKGDPELELKLVALDALLNMDAEMAFPILEKIVRGAENPKLRERAIFVLSQSKDPKVVPIMVEMATKDPDIKVKGQAIFWLGQRRTKESVEALLKIYETTTDIQIKDKLIFAFSQNRNEKAREKLIEIAKNDPDNKAKEKAIFWLGQRQEKESLDALIQIYDTTTDPKIKEKLIFAFSQNKDKQTSDKLTDIARNDADLKSRERAIFWLGQRKD